eukprot:11077326-Karenia_brevis.AAC.1
MMDKAKAEVAPPGAGQQPAGNDKARCRLLKEHPSDPKKADEKATEELAKDSEKCAEQGLYYNLDPVSYTHLRAHETLSDL